MRRVSAVSLADQPSTSLRSSTARWRGGNCWLAAMNANRTVSRRSYWALGPGDSSLMFLSSKSGRGSIHGMSAVQGPRETAEIVGKNPARTCPAAQRHQAHIRCDAIEPARERGAALELIEALPGFQHGLLHEILGVVQGAGKTIAMRKQFAAMRRENRFEIISAGFGGTFGLGWNRAEENGRLAWHAGAG